MNNYHVISWNKPEWWRKWIELAEWICNKHDFKIGSAQSRLWIEKHSEGSPFDNQKSMKLMKELQQHDLLTEFNSPTLPQKRIP